MKLFITIAIVCIGFVTSAQDCNDPSIAGYRRDTAVTIDEARRVILTSFAATNNCNLKLKLRSGDFYLFTPEGSIVLVENFNSPIDDATKLRLISKLKPGFKIMLDNMHYGDENKLVPPVSLTLLKGRS